MLLSSEGETCSLACLPATPAACISHWGHCSQLERERAQVVAKCRYDLHSGSSLFLAQEKEVACVSWK